MQATLYYIGKMLLKLKNFHNSVYYNIWYFNVQMTHSIIKEQLFKVNLILSQNIINKLEKNLFLSFI